MYFLEDLWRAVTAFAAFDFFLMAFLVRTCSRIFVMACMGRYHVLGPPVTRSGLDGKSRYAVNVALYAALAASRAAESHGFRGRFPSNNKQVIQVSFCAMMSQRDSTKRSLMSLFDRSIALQNPVQPSRPSTLSRTYLQDPDGAHTFVSAARARVAVAGAT